MIFDASPAKERLFLGLGAISGFVSVALGAFGAHALEARLPAERLAVFETGADYQFLHALALGLAALVIGRRRGRAAPIAAWLFACGTILFSGSLYVYAFSGVSAWGAVTPFGGVCWLAGWASLAFSAFRPRTVLGEAAVARDELIEVSGGSGAAGDRS